MQQSLALAVEQDMVELPGVPARDRMAADYAGTGISPYWHPLGLLRPHLPRGIARSTDLERLPHNMTLSIAGMVVCRQRPGTAKGVTFLLLEDEVGLVNVVMQKHLYESERLLVRGEPFPLISGMLQKQLGTINLLAHTFQPLNEARRRLPQVQSVPEPTVPEEVRVLAPVLPEASVGQLNTVRPASHNYR